MNVRSFLSKNLIAIVIVPVIIGGHYTWYTLQKDDRLVSAADRKKLPFSSLLFGNSPFSWDAMPISDPARDWSDFSEFENQMLMQPCNAQDFVFNFL